MTKKLTSLFIVLSLVLVLFGNTISASSFSPDSGVGAFVARIYEFALGRQYDEQGYQDWCYALTTGSSNGADCAKGFLFSQEFASKNYSVEEYINILYKVFFDRESDYAGYKNWENALVNGATYESIVDGFVNSSEWANTCASYGIISGGTYAPSIIPPTTEGVYSFINLLYSKVLGREGDSEGVRNWSNALMSMSISGKDVAHNFFYSQEFTNKWNAISDIEKVSIFYDVFLQRPGDEAGINYWLSELANNNSIDLLYNGFANSEEFVMMCSSFGIVASIDSRYSQVGLPLNQTYVIRTPEGLRTLRGHFDYANAEDIIEETNELRTSLGLDTFETNDQEANRIAELRSLEIAYGYDRMYDIPNFGHQRMDGTYFPVLLSRSRSAGENIAFQTIYEVESFYVLWKNSESHYNNMVKTYYNYIGVAVFVPEYTRAGFATQIFLG